MLFFALVYVVEGMGQTGGLVAQPLNYFLKQQYGWTPLQITAALAVLNLPWVIKPLYGLVSDFIPLFGYRRKSYLVLANGGGALAYLAVASLDAPAAIVSALLLSAYAMAVSSTLSGAVLVENGQRLRLSDRFVNQEWLWYSIAAMVSSLLGGWMIEHLSPAGAFHAAALTVAAAPLLAVFGSIALIRDERSRPDLATLKATFRGLVGAFKRRDLWIVALFLFLYWFNPGLGTPLYYYMTDTLKFSQAFIGVLGAVSSAGSIAGALLYRWVLSGLGSKTLLYLSIILGAVATLSFLGLHDQSSAIAANFAAGLAAMISLVASLTLAADFCPKRSEGFTFAALMSVTNLAMSVGDNLGSFLFEHAFSNRLAPLILASALGTLIAAPFVPILRLGGKRPGEALAAAE